MTANDSCDSFLRAGAVCKNRHSCHNRHRKENQMKQIIITVAALTAGAGAALLLLSRSSAKRIRKPCMTFAELYADNLCGVGSLFD